MAKLVVELNPIHRGTKQFRERPTTRNKYFTRFRPKLAILLTDRIDDGFRGSVVRMLSNSDQRRRQPPSELLMERKREGVSLGGERIALIFTYSI